MGSLEGTIDTKLHEAVRYGDIDEVKVALQQGYDPNLIGLYQWSSLHEAASNGETEILQLLLQKKGDPNKKDLLGGNTSVHYAARESHIDCLQLLINAGGRYDVQNNDGKSCLDMAKGACFSMLESLRVKDLMLMSPEEVKKQITEKELKSHEADTVTSYSSETSQAEDVTSPALGYIHLTFEYHSHKASLKVKVWQISDLLLPPPSSSNISTIYVKSFLMPDKRNNSKRKTEEVKVDRSDAHIQTKKLNAEKGGIQHVFSPSTFKFSKKLEYEEITAAIIKERSIQIEVCITQRYTKKSFLIAMFHMPLKEAIKKIVREKYPLIPCVNHTIPINMRVYCASQLQITNSAKVFYSNPDIRNLSISDMSEFSDRAASDPDLKGMPVSRDATTPRNVVLNISDENEGRNEHHHYKEDDKKSSVVIPGETFNLDDSLNESGYGTMHSPSQVVKILDSDDEMPETRRKSAFSSVIRSVKSKTKVERINGTPSERRDSDSSSTVSPRGVEDWKYKQVKQNSGSRPETPTWDYYDFDLQTVEIPLDESQKNKDGPAHVCLPMETTLGLKVMPLSPKKEKQSKRHSQDSKKKSGDHHIPQIIVTDSESGISKNIVKSDIDEIKVISDKPRSAKRKSRLKDVKIHMNQNQDYDVKSKHGKIEVIAEVHKQPKSQWHLRETAIDIEDNDSVIIDLENLESELNQIDTEPVVPSTSVNMEAQDSKDLSSTLTVKKTVPQHVFIDDSLYESGDDTSELSEFTLPFVPINNNNHMVSEL